VIPETGISGKFQRILGDVGGNHHGALLRKGEKEERGAKKSGAGRKGEEVGEIHEFALCDGWERQWSE